MTSRSSRVLIKIWKKRKKQQLRPKRHQTQLLQQELSTTDDIDGEIEEKTVEIKPALNDIEKNLLPFIGTVMQTPPIYSSIKIQGKPAHRRVRKGETVVMESRQVEIKSIEIISYEYPILKLKISTGPGVYIRAIARDLGEKLGTGGYLSALKRTRVATFDINSALELDEFKY